MFLNGFLMELLTDRKVEAGSYEFLKTSFLKKWMKKCLALGRKIMLPCLKNDHPPSEELKKTNPLWVS